jgi:hypothetical protein
MGLWSPSLSTKQFDKIDTRAAVSMSLVVSGVVVGSASGWPSLAVESFYMTMP